MLLISTCDWIIYSGRHFGEDRGFHRITLHSKLGLYDSYPSYGIGLDSSNTFCKPGVRYLDQALKSLRQ